jgi:DNA topoisomerase-1
MPADTRNRTNRSAAPGRPRSGAHQRPIRRPLLSEETFHPGGRLVAKAAGLRYVTDTKPGIRRKRAGRSFTYLGPDGGRVRDPQELQRIRSLAIPPAWTDVWICPSANGHVQATGRDAKGRKQYRYHPRWREVQDETKYDRMLLFAVALPQVRTRVTQDLSRAGLPRERVLATVLQLMERTFIRVGNEEYARQNQSYGLTTLQGEHVDLEGSTIHFHFRGKSGKEHEIDLRDRRLAQIIRKCQALPGQELFQYLDADGQPHTVSSCDLNAYLREISGQDFTAKDFRTWAGTLLAFHLLREMPDAETEAQARKNVTDAIKQVAARLGNTPAVCRKCYVHPVVLDAYLNAETRSLLRAAAVAEADTGGLPQDEAILLAFLRKQLQRDPLQLSACPQEEGGAH